MKKTFIIISLLASNYAFAEDDPKVYFGGDISVNSGIVSQDTLYSQDDLPGVGNNKNPLNQDSYFAQDADLDVVTIGNVLIVVNVGIQKLKILVMVNTKKNSIGWLTEIASPVDM